MGKRFATVFSIIILLCITLSVHAQATRDYAITSIEATPIDAGDTTLVTVIITNNGADAQSETDVIVRILGDTPQELVRSTLIPLGSGSAVTLEIPFGMSLFTPGTQPTLEFSVGIDEVEAQGSAIAADNVQTISLSVPDNRFVLIARDGNIITLADQPYTLLEFSIGVLTIVFVLMFFWVFSILVRALFQRPPRFGPWQPPYGVMPMYDQNTVEGRRWGWQQVAQNGLLLAPPTEGNVHPVKLLLSADGITLKNWKVTGMRLSQYDVYGRIARTQILAEKKWIRRMNTVLKKRTTVDEAKLQKFLRPIADHMVKQFTKKVGKKTAFLPISFDLRWEGKHGDVRIIFELYQFSERAWFRIDKWDPMMQVVSQTMQENYTFTIHGKENAEKMREFRERLRDDLIWLLLESFRIEPIAEDRTGGQPAVREQFDVPDTLSGMDPIQPDDQPVTTNTDNPTA